MFECYKTIGTNFISFFLRVPEVRIETQLTQMEKNQLYPQCEDFLATVLSRPADTRGILGSYPQIFLCPTNFVVFRKICFEHMIKTKIFPP